MNACMIMYVTMYVVTQEIAYSITPGVCIA